MLALKENHLTLHSEVVGIFEAVCKDDNSDGAVSITESRETGHGRMEPCRCWSIEAPAWLSGFAEWKNLKSLVMIEATREVKDQKTTENRYYLASLAPNAEIVALAVRNHCGVENSLDWSLDVTFRKDDSRVRVGHAFENLALVRKMTHSLLQ